MLRARSGRRSSPWQRQAPGTSCDSCWASSQGCLPLIWTQRNSCWESVSGGWNLSLPKKKSNFEFKYLSFFTLGSLCFKAVVCRLPGFVCFQVYDVWGILTEDRAQSVFEDMAQSACLNHTAHQVLWLDQFSFLWVVFQGPWTSGNFGQSDVGLHWVHLSLFVLTAHFDRGELCAVWVLLLFFGGVRGGVAVSVLTAGLALCCFCSHRRVSLVLFLFSQQG